MPIAAARAGTITDTPDVPFSPKRPGRVMRAAFRAPVWLYRLHLGRVLGTRFLLLRHEGRKTGQPHDVVLEVIAREGDEVFVISGYGNDAGWLRNLHAHPPLLVETGGRRFVPVARFLDATEAETILDGYAHRNPCAASALGRRLYGGEFSPSRLADATTVVGLRPAATASRG